MISAVDAKQGVLETSMEMLKSVFVRYLLYSRLYLNGHLYKTDTSVKRTLRVGPCLSLLLLFDSL